MTKLAKLSSWIQVLALPHNNLWHICMLEDRLIKLCLEMNPPNNGKSPRPWPPDNVSISKEFIRKTPNAWRMSDSWHFSSISFCRTLTRLSMWFFMTWSLRRSFLWSMSLSTQLWSKGGWRFFCASKSLRTPISEKNCKRKATKNEQCCFLNHSQCWQLCFLKYKRRKLHYISWCFIRWMDWIMYLATLNHASTSRFKMVWYWIFAC